MRITIGVLTLIVAESLLVLALYFARVNHSWSATRSDFAAFYLPAIVTAAVCTAATYWFGGGEHARPSLGISLLIGGVTGVVGLLVGLGLAISLWGS